MVEKKFNFVDYGYVQNVYMSSRTAYYYYKMVEKGLNDLKENQFVGKLGSMSVKLYIEGQEHKIKEAKKIALKYENTGH